MKKNGKISASNVNFRTKLDTAGQELTADLDFIQYKATSVQPLTSIYTLII